MDYMEIFNDVNSIIKNDYSGFIDKKDWGRPDEYRDIIQKHIEEGSITPHIFQSIVSEFLLDYKDAHMYFCWVTVLKPIKSKLDLE